jgi:hypothetical protein
MSGVEHADDLIEITDENVETFTAIRDRLTSQRAWFVSQVRRYPIELTMPGYRCVCTEKSEFDLLINVIEYKLGKFPCPHCYKPPLKRNAAWQWVKKLALTPVFIPGL